MFAGGATSLRVVWACAIAEPSYRIWDSHRVQTTAGLRSDDVDAGPWGLPNSHPSPQHLESSEFARGHHPREVSHALPYQYAYNSIALKLTYICAYWLTDRVISSRRLRIFEFSGEIVRFQAREGRRAVRVLADDRPDAYRGRPRLGGGGHDHMVVRTRNSRGDGAAEAIRKVLQAQLSQPGNSIRWSWHGSGVYPGVRTSFVRATPSSARIEIEKWRRVIVRVLGLDETPASEGVRFKGLTRRR